jgi:hypothetical protein
MAPVTLDDEQLRTWRRDFLLGLHDIAKYAATRGSPLFLPGHISFLMAYVGGWLGPEHGPDNEKADNEKAVMETLFRRVPKWVRQLILRLLQAGRIPEKAKRLILITPLLIPLVVTLPWQIIWAGANSAWDILGKGIRSVPPLVTAMVVVFVTSDAWRILGTGFTPRFFMLVSTFLLASLLFLIRRDWWADFNVDKDEATSLLQGIKHWNPRYLNELIRWGAEPVPVDRPRRLRGADAYMTYLALIAFALIAVALFVSIILIIIGLILINSNETKNLAGSVYIYHPFPGIMVTKQLLSLALSLGAFAAFFLVAAQRSDERDEFIKNTLARYRRALVVYTTYCQARDSAEDWTGIPIKWELRKKGTLEPDHHEDDAAIPDIDAIA